MGTTIKKQVSPPGEYRRNSRRSSSMIEEIEVGVKKVCYERLFTDGSVFDAKIDKVIGMS